MPSSPQVTRELAADELKKVGFEAGLSAVGITSAESFDSTRMVLEERKAAGLAAGMQFTYRNPSRSTDPSRIIPGAQSLIVGAWRYARGVSEELSAEGPLPGYVAGRVARYARADHYAALRIALEAVAERLRQAGWQAAVVLDSNALVDREAAVRAGIGWYGKNTNVLITRAGSWFVLGSVVTDAPLPIDELASGGCGSCHACADACPTGALDQPGVLDARRCLAWLLQAPGAFPVEHRMALGDRIYGCDECQVSCPVNKVTVRRPPAVTIIPDVEPEVDILAMLSADDDELLDRYGRWYIAHRDPRYLRRNALVVLGNVGRSGDPAVIGVLRRYLSHADSLLRAHAVWAARRLGHDELLTDIDDSDELVKEELTRSSQW